METTIDGFELEPRYGTNEIAGKCLKCLGEEKLNFCLRELLRGEYEDEALKARYELLMGFLVSPDFEELRQESERLLSEGKRVAVRVTKDPASGENRYTLIIKSEGIDEEDYNESGTTD
jgi:uncharacterized protein YceH (UPF0502 family)